MGQALKTRAHQGAPRVAILGQKNSQFVIVLHVTMWPSAMIIYQRVVQLHVGYNMIQPIVKPKKKNQTESGTCFQDGINDVYHM